MVQLFKSFIPTEFLDAWMGGQYVIGPRTLDYQYAGLALILQGFYRYDVMENNDELFGGFAVVYIKDYELKFAGYRLYPARSRSYPAGTRREPIPVFWKSVFSRFTEEEGHTKIYFPYYVYLPSEQTSLHVDGRERLDGIESARPVEQSAWPEVRGRQHLNNIESHRAADLRPILTKLSDDKEDDLLGIPELRGLCVLTIPRKSRINQQNNMDRRSELVLIGKNYGVLADRPISGDVTYERKDKEFLDQVDPPLPPSQKA